MTNDLNTLKAVARAATKEPWIEFADSGEWFIIAANKDEPRFFCPTFGMKQPDVDHIATFDPPTVLGLIEEIETLRAKVGKEQSCVVQITNPVQDLREGDRVAQIVDNFIDDGDRVKRTFLIQRQGEPK